MESELLDHEARNDLRLVLQLERGLDGAQALLADQEREQPDVDAVQVVVHIAQPLVLVLAVALRLVEEHHDHAAAVACARILDPADELQALGRIAAPVRIRTADGFKQAGEERPFGMLGLVLGLHMVGRDLRVLLRHEQAQILDGACLADS